MNEWSEFDRVSKSFGKFLKESKVLLVLTLDAVRVGVHSFPYFKNVLFYQLVNEKQFNK